MGKVYNTDLMDDVLTFINSEAGHYEIIGYVVTDKLTGKRQEEEGPFDHSFVDQSCGYSGDDYSGFIYLPVNDKYLKIYFYG
jgi:hypothetical protein